MQQATLFVYIKGAGVGMKPVIQFKQPKEKGIFNLLNCGNSVIDKTMMKIVRPYFDEYGEMKMQFKDVKLKSNGVWIYIEKCSSYITLIDTLQELETEEKIFGILKLY